MATVAQILGSRQPQFNTVSCEHLMSDALNQMCCENLDYLIVVDKDKFTGILTEHDIANKVVFANKPLHEIKVKEFMNRNLPVASSSNTVENCMHLLERYKARHIAIYDEFTFKGIISSDDLMKYALEMSFAQTYHHD